MTEKNKTYDLYISLGAVCSCSQVLRKANLQFWSYPFDWLAGGSIQKRVEILNNNFDNWLNINDLIFTGTRETPEPKNIFYNKTTGIFYNHDFTINTPLESCYDEVIEKYKRRIARMLEQINIAKKVCFVYIDTPDNINCISDEELKNLHNILQNKFINTKIDLLYLFENRNIDIRQAKKTKITNDITKIEFDFDMYIKDNVQLVDVKKTAEIFKKYNITNLFVTPQNKKKKTLYKIKIALEKFFHLTNVQYKGEKYKQLTLFGITKRLTKIKE